MKQAIFRHFFVISTIIILSAFGAGAGFAQGKGHGNGHGNGNGNGKHGGGAQGNNGGGQGQGNGGWKHGGDQGRIVSAQPQYQVRQQAGGREKGHAPS